MKEVTVTVGHGGKNYLTNVLADREMSDEEIMEKARQQVLDQLIQE